MHSVPVPSSPRNKDARAAIADLRKRIGRIGDDDFGRMGLALWAREGIDPRHVVQAAGERSGVAQILVYEDGDNSIAVAPGAGLGLNAQHVQAAQGMVSACKVVMASLEVPQRATCEAFALAKQAGAWTLLNPAPAQPVDAALWRMVDVLTPNESELQSLSGLPAHASLQEAAQVLLSEGVQAVVVTLGEKVRHLRNHGLEEGVSTRLLIYAGQLIRQGVAPARACEAAVIAPITDDPDMQRSIAELVKAVF